jgi:hypothetical protein
MHLTLPVSANWSSTTSESETVYVVEPSLTLSASKLTPLPLNLSGWGDRLVLGATPPDRYRLVSLSERHTEAGWPVTIFISDVLAAAGGEPIERRIHGLYRFLEYGATAVARCPSPAQLDARRDELIGILERGAPDWSGPIVTLMQIWKDVPPKTPTP